MTAVPPVYPRVQSLSRRQWPSEVKVVFPDLDRIRPDRGRQIWEGKPI
jgi:hypothetical protein